MKKVVTKKMKKFFSKFLLPLFNMLQLSVVQHRFSMLVTLLIELRQVLEHEKVNVAVLVFKNEADIFRIKILIK